MTKLPTTRAALLGALLTVSTASAAFAQAPASCDTVSALDKVVALNAIQNLMGRYSHLGQLRGEGTLSELFAMNTPGVSWRTPGGPIGIEQMKERFDRPQEQLQPGVLRMHTMFTPVIEIAGDGQTAKGVWDSFGPSVGGPNDEGGWFQAKYGVDFVKENGVWKIWHLQVYAIYTTPYNESITQSAKERLAKAAAGGGAPGGAPPGGPPRGDGPAPIMYPRPAHAWSYDGKSVEQGPEIPSPYCHFDPNDVYILK